MPGSGFPTAKGPVARAYRKLFRAEAWNIGVVHSPIHAFLEPGFTPEVQWLPDPGPGRFRADPFGIRIDGRLHILCEELDYRTGKGTIAAIEVSGGGVRSSTAIRLPVHMSYPYLVRRHDEVYCIPETSQAGEVVLYRADAFPARWTEAAVLIPGLRAADCTVFEREGRWWMMCAGEHEGFNSRLLIWYAPDLFGPWKPHPLNPLKDDVSCSRPAGTPFVHEGSLYRPAQDCSRTYGGRVVINRVNVLTSDDFHEETVAAVEPQADGPYPHGMHTLSAVGDITLVDGKRERFIPQAAAWLLRDKIHGLCSSPRN